MNRYYGALLTSLLFLVPTLAFASTSVSVEALAPASTVSVGTDVTFTVATNGFSNPSFSIADSFSGSTVSNSDIVSSTDSNGNAIGAFSWTPTTGDTGTHTLTISISDAEGDTGIATETITVANGPTVSVNSINPGYSIAYGLPLTFSVVATGFTDPVYTVGDSVSNSSLSSADIGSSGYFSWTPNSNDVGQHTLTVTVADSSGHTANQQLQINVLNPYITVESLKPGQNVSVGSPLTFQIVPTGFSNPTFSLSDSFTSSTLSSADINSFGYASWIPVLSDTGTHYLTLVANDDDYHNATDTITVIVGNSSATGAPPGTIIYVPVNSSGTVSQSVTSSAPSASASVAGFNAPFTSYLEVGSTGWEVSQLQAILSNLGYLTASASGYFGLATKAAVEKFQSADGLSIIGAVGPETRALLNEIVAAKTSSGNTTSVSVTTTAAGSASSGATSSSPAKPSYIFSAGLSVGSQGPAVTALQNRLTSEGVYSGPITGYFGAATKAAVEKYQTKHDLSVVGVLGPETRAYLNEGL